MDGFEWALDNLADYGADSPHGLQAQGVNVFFAPNIEPNTKVVDLGTGRVVRFVDGERRPLRGYYAARSSPTSWPIRMATRRSPCCTGRRSASPRGRTSWA